MKMHMYAGVSLLLVMAASASAEPLTFGMFESNHSRRDRFERHFVIGEKLNTFEVGKKRVALPAGNWMISEVETNAPDVTEEGSSTVVSETADAWLSVQDVDTGDFIAFSTSLSAFKPRVSFTQLIGACQKDHQQKKNDWTNVARQQDSLREDRQSCVRTSARLARSRSGGVYLQLRTEVLESWRADYLAVDRLHSMQVTDADDLQSLLQQPATNAYLDQQLRWGSQLKADIARQMGW